jgi:hypothetical protein
MPNVVRPGFSAAASGLQVGAAPSGAGDFRPVTAAATGTFFIPRMPVVEQSIQDFCVELKVPAVSGSSARRLDDQRERAVNRISLLPTEDFSPDRSMGRMEVRVQGKPVYEAPLGYLMQSYLQPVPGLYQTLESGSLTARLRLTVETDPARKRALEGLLVEFDALLKRCAEADGGVVPGGGRLKIPIQLGRDDDLQITVFDYPGEALELVFVLAGLERRDIR